MKRAGGSRANGHELSLGYFNCEMLVRYPGGGTRQAVGYKIRVCRVPAKKTHQLGELKIN